MLLCTFGERMMPSGIFGASELPSNDLQMTTVLDVCQVREPRFWVCSGPFRSWTSTYKSRNRTTDITNTKDWCYGPDH
jgi:hypothetical protein